MQRLDTVDMKLLHALSLNCRKPLKQVAKSLRISLSTLQFRMKRLNEREIIRRYQTLLNYSPDPVLYARLIIKVRRLIDLEKVITILKKLDFIEFLAVFHGTFDIGIAILGKSPHSVQERAYSVSDLCATYTQEQKISLVLTIHHCAPNILFGNQAFIEPVKEVFGQVVPDISKNQRLVLKELQKNPIKSIVNISSDLDLSSKTVLQCKRDLEKDIIARYRAIINTSAVGYERYHIFWEFEKATPQSIASFRNFLLVQKETYYITEALGEYLLESEFLVTNGEMLEKLIKRIEMKFPDILASYNVAKYKRILIEK